MKIKCLYPFIYADFAFNGDVYCCCPTWTKIGPIGNLKKNSIKEIWNNEKVQFIRKNIYKNRLQRICNLTYCPLATSKNFFNLEQKSFRNDPILKHITKEIRRKRLILKTLPARINLSNSGKCNLRCKMCISNEKFCPTDEILSKKIWEEVIPQLLPSLRYIRLTGNGDPLYQKEISKFLQNFDPKKYPNIEFEILTNGLLLNQKMWDSIKHNKIKTISVSIDASSKKTYERIRKGGRWQILQRNLKLISNLRKNKKIKHFSINMVVMKSNYKEMKQFLKMGKKLGCDRVEFSKIFGLTPECVEENINFFKNYKIFREIAEILEDPKFTKPPADIRGFEFYKNYRPPFLAKIKFYVLLQKTLFPISQIYYKLPYSLRFLRLLK